MSLRPRPRYFGRRRPYRCARDGKCVTHQAWARSSVHVSAPATSASWRDSSFAGGRFAGSLARHESTSRSRAARQVGGE